MAEDPPDHITVLLRAAFGGQESAQSELLPVLYDELRRLAGRLMQGERREHTLQATALVHEAWARLISPELLVGLDEEEARRTFVALAGRAMRRVLIDHARKRKAERRGGDWERVTLSGDLIAPDLDDTALLDLESALANLEQQNGRLVRIAELRLFAGLSPQETASVLGLGITTVVDEWALAKALLSQQLGGG